MRRGDELVLNAMERDLVRLTKIASKAKKDADDVINATTELLDANADFRKIVDEGITGADVVARLEAIKRRRDKALRLMKKPLLPLLDKQNETQFAQEDMQREIENFKWRAGK